MLPLVTPVIPLFSPSVPFLLHYSCQPILPPLLQWFLLPPLPVSCFLPKLSMHPLINAFFFTIIFASRPVETYHFSKIFPPNYTLFSLLVVFIFSICLKVDANVLISFSLPILPFSQLFPLNTFTPFPPSRSPSSSYGLPHAHPLNITFLLTSSLLLFLLRYIAYALPVYPAFPFRPPKLGSLLITYLLSFLFISNLFYSLCLN